MTQSAKVVADSVSPQGIRLTTVQLRYPKFVHGELMTHRVFSRNASSSRAIPVERLIKDVMEDPAMPIHWGKNQPGMSAREEQDTRVEVYGWGGGTERTRQGAWLLARNNAIKAAQAFHAAGYHKQIVNRIIEPWCHINVIVTSTDWSNFFALRCHPDAQPEMRDLAEKIRDAMAASTPEQLKPGEWHLPYVVEDDYESVQREELRTENSLPYNEYKSQFTKISVARCARVSYLTQDGKAPSISDDLKLYDRLVGSVPLHASPAEHQATPDEMIEGHIGPYGEWRTKRWQSSYLHGNFHGWVQYRKTLPGESQ